ncbi:MAG: hypothetical protein HY376_03060 [Candidatus Blackburnbacteria bacterium]|nr:hypothetical protein [Candidatus Blackburnbacteria bacterium]
MSDFLNFKDISKAEQKTKRFGVYSTHSGDYLGYIAWDGGWRRYVMNFDVQCKWSVECMAQCYKFMAKLMQERKEAVK